MTDTAHRTPRRPRHASRWPLLLLLLLLLGLCYAVAAVGAVATGDAGSTYESLDRPAWAPPPWLFGPVWTVLYATIAFSFWLVLRRCPLRDVRPEAFAWSAQLAFNLAWTPLFFAAGQYGLAFLDICFLLAALGATIVLFRRRSTTASLLLAPYALWAVYAAALNLAIWQLNT
ncbi:TspO/MBR family protein [Streptomyces sp. t39]|uniref:TspO/MBR family protein n=1 Tax=Streptomyces sp. t39 TaxID=1828156 RepID=UPI0021C9CA1E|nr:TspO/MBR family protein [Streptomyces sp. t39]